MIEYKQDWDTAKQRINAFWQGEIIDRCCVGIVCPKGNPYTGPVAENSRQKWIDDDFIYNRFIAECEYYEYLGESFPHIFFNLGPGVVSEFIGGGYGLDNNTVWFDVNLPIKDMTNLPDIRLRRDTELWQVLHRQMERFYPEAGKRWICGITDLGGTLDIAASLRGTQQLLCDLIEYPDEVLGLIEKIDSVWIECYNELIEYNNSYQLGNAAWMPIWREENWSPIQCDFGAMISPEMFVKFAIPSIERQAKAMNGHGVFHLDGPQMLCHLEYILDIPEIEAIQWVPLYTSDGMLDFFNPRYFDVYKRIQQKGKRLIMLGVNPLRVEELLEEISAKGLFLYINSQDIKGPDDAEYILKKISRYTD